jgi:hypothetical protein
VTDDLIAFIRARLDDDERGAPSEHYNPDEGGYYSCPAARDEGYGKGDCLCGLAEKRRRALAEVDAKRRILEWLTPVDRTGMAAVLLRTLALPYASHTDFRAEWKLA